MNNKNIWNKFYECDCSSEGIMLGYDSELKELINLAFFHNGLRCDSGNKFSLKEKLRWCWQILAKGCPWTDLVMLNKNNARNLGNDLLKWANNSPFDVMPYESIVLDTSKQFCKILDLQDKYKEAQSLIDGAYEIVMMHEVKTPAEIKWKEDWLKNARKHGASLDC